jgi:hypothetical protein
MVIVYEELPTPLTVEFELSYAKLVHFISVHHTGPQRFNVAIIRYKVTES